MMMQTQQQPDIDFKGLYRRYTLLVWLAVIYAASLAVAQAGFFIVIFYTYLVVFSGKMFYDFANKKDFINIWTGSTAVAAIIFSLFASTLSFFPVEGLVIAGFAGGALGLIAAIATYMPNAPMKLFMFGPFPFKYLAIGLIVLDIFSAGSDVQATGSGVSHSAHLLGAATGFAYIYFRQKGYKTEKFFSWLHRSSEPRMKAKKGGKKDKDYKKPPADDIEYNEEKKQEQQQIDEILDKISKSGYESLTKKEKELLFRKSKD